MLAIKITPPSTKLNAEAPLSWSEFTSRLASLPWDPSPSLQYGAEALGENIDRGLSAELGIPCRGEGDQEVPAPLVHSSLGASLHIVNDAATGDTLSVFKVFLTPMSIRIMAWCPHQSPVSVQDSEHATSIGEGGEGLRMSRVPTIVVPYAEIAHHVKNDDQYINGSLGPKMCFITQRLREAAELVRFARSAQFDLSGMEALVTAPYLVELNFSIEWRKPELSLGNRAGGSCLDRPQLVLSSRIFVPKGHEFDPRVLKSSDGELWTSNWCTLAVFKYENGRVIRKHPVTDQADIAKSEISLETLDAEDLFSKDVSNIGLHRDQSAKPQIQAPKGMLRK